MRLLFFFFAPRVRLLSFIFLAFFSLCAMTCSTPLSSPAAAPRFANILRPTPRLCSSCHRRISRTATAVDQRERMPTKPSGQKDGREPFPLSPESVGMAKTWSATLIGAPGFHVTERHADLGFHVTVISMSECPGLRVLCTYSPQGEGGQI